MNEFLKDYYNTASGGNDDADALEKMAQLTLLTKEAEEEGIDLSDLSDDEVMELADELYGNDGEAESVDDSGDLEKEAAAKFEEADFLGRVMAHSMWQELDSIQKEAAFGEAARGVGRAIKTLGREGYEAAKGGLRRAHGATLGRIGEAAEEGMSKRVAAAIGKQKGRKSEFFHTGKQRKLRKGEFTQSDVAKIMRRGRQANIAAQIGTGVGAAGAAGAAGYGGYRGVKALRGKEKEGSALNALIEQRAVEHLAAAGYVDQQGNVYGPEKTASDNDFNTVVDRAALELLEQNGYSVQWR